MRVPSIYRFLSYSLILMCLFTLIKPQKVEATAGILKQINFQGKVVNKTVGTNVTNGNYDFTFKLYDAASSGSLLWTETRTGGNQVAVTDGIFRVSLGSVTALPGSVDFNTDNLYLDITFNGETMSTRVQFAAVPYAFNALKVAGLTVTDTTGTFTLTAGKTLSVANTLAFAGTDSTTITFQGTDTYVGRATTDTLTNKTVGSTGLVFSGATTDIDTASSEGLALQGRAASSFNTTSGAISFQAAGTGTISTVQVGAGGSGSTTPDFLGLDVKSDTGDPAGGFEGAMYYNTFDNKFRCYQGSAWADCITTASSSLWSGLGTPTGNLSLSMAEYTSAFNWDTASTAAAFDGLTMSINNDAGTDSNTQRLLVLTNANDGGSTGTTERLLVLDNLDTNEAVTTALEIASTGGAAITTALDLSDSDIVTALSLGPNDVTATSWSVAGSTGIGTFAGGVFNGNVDMTNDLILNIGDAGTDFTSGGGLNLTGAFDTQSTIQAGSGNITLTDSTGNILESAIADGSVYSRLGAAETVTGGWTFNTSATIFTTALNANGGLTTSTTNTALTLGANGSGDIVFSNDADTNVQITSGAASTVDMIAETNSGFGTTTDGVDGLAIDFTSATDGATDTNAGAHITITDSGDSGDTISGLQVTAGGAAAGTQYGINIEGITAGGGTEYALVVGTGWDRGLSIGSASTFTAALTSEATTVIGSSGNTFTFNPASGPVYAGTARPTKRITLTPEYSGATMTADGANNTGTMTSDNMTSTPYRNYYKWANTQISAQDYDIWIKVPLPADFAAMAATPTLSIDTYTSDAVNGTVTATVYDTSNTGDCAAASFTPTSTTTWQTKTQTTCLDSGTYVANGVMTIDIKLTGAASTGDTRVGTISFDYLAQF